MVFIEERFIFTYEDYLNYFDNWKYLETKEKFIDVAEENVEYTFDDEKIVTNEKQTGDKKHDKIFKDILQNKKEMASFLNNFIEYKVKAEDLQNYNPNYITKNFKYKQIDILYKVKGKQIFFLLEHQTKVDYTMPYRILNYCIEIIRSLVEEGLNNRKNKYPIIMPIVLYTGNNKWTAPISFVENQEKDENLDFKAIDIKYKLVDINKYDAKELLNKNSMLTNVMILEKCKNNKDVINCLRDIINNLKDDVQKEKLKRIVLYLYKDIKVEDIEEMFKIIEESESEETMSTIRDRISREFRMEREKARELGMAEGLEEGRAKGREEGREEGRAEGRAEGISQGIVQGIAQTIANMIKMNFKDEIIKQATGANKTEIQRIRKQIMKV